MFSRKVFVGINEIALKYFLDCFQASNKAKKYVYSRISEQTTKDFYVGYAPKYGLIKTLNDNAVEQKDAEELGLIGVNADGTAYETFSERIILPVIHAGMVLGFGGRTVVDNPTKYLNSKSSSLYNKGEVLYGLWKARKEISKLNYAILVEGYFDVLGLYNVGIKNVIAVCGTAFRKEHALLLNRYTDRLVVLMDPDEAGQKGAKKVKNTLLGTGITSVNVKLPKKLDPDEFAQQYGKESLEEMIKAKLNIG